MKIWILNHYAGDTFFDGGGRHYAFAKYMKKSGHEPVVFCSNTKHGIAEHYFDFNERWKQYLQEEIDVPYVFVGARIYVGNGKQRVLNMIDFYRNVKRVVKEYAKVNGKPDIIFASSVHPLTMLAGIKIAKKFGIKCVCEIRDLWPESLVAYGIAGSKNPAVLYLRRLEKKIYKDADDIVFTMEGAYDYIVEQRWEKQVPREKVHYINNGVDLENYRCNREKYRIEDEDLDNKSIFKVVYTGSIRKVNNLGTLLDIAKEVRNPRIHFLIWGDGDEKEILEKRVQTEKINNVKFKGRVDKQYIPYITSCADLNIAHNTATSLFRFGISFNKIFDYFASEKPILSDFWCKYNPAIMMGAGLEVEKATPKTVADAVERFANMDSKEYDVYCENARKAAEKYDFKKLTEELLAVIEKQK